MGKLFNYNKPGPGVAKEGTVERKKYGFANYFINFKRKFWKIFSVNVLTALCLIPVLVLVWLCFNGMFGEGTRLAQHLEEKNAAYVYTDFADKYSYSYNFSDQQVEEAIVHLDKLYEIIHQKNPDVVTGGLEDFDASLYSDSDILTISDEFSKFAKCLGFTATFDENSASLYYGETETAKFEFADDSVTISNTIPYSFRKFAMSVLCFAPLILLAPVFCVAFRLMRDYVRGETVFFWHDVLDTLKSNWWQSLVIGVVQYIGTAILIIALRMYYAFSENGIFYAIGFGICLLATYVFTSMHFYIYLMQVSLTLNLRKIYKNALLFSVVGLFRNILVVALVAAVAFLLFIMYVVGLGNTFVMSLFVSIALILPLGWFFYTTTYIIYPKIQQLVIDPYYEELSKKDGEGNALEDVEEVVDDEQSEYVYHNGKMVHRSIYEKEILFQDDVSNHKE